MKTLSIALLFCLFAAGTVSSAALAKSANQPEAIKQLAQQLRIDPQAIKPAPMAGFYEVSLGAHIVYISADGRYLLRGDIIDLQNQVNLSEQRRAETRLDLIAAVPENRIIKYPAKDQQHVITAFIDIDCGYCRKLHSEMEAINARGISVHYLFFPRAGVGSSSWHKAQAVWCAADRKSALDRAMQGLPVTSADCDASAILAQYQLGQKVGVSGTPAIVVDDGELIRGYLPANQLLRVLESE
ncbi:MAG TPA: thioredoxin fold domain-containing protein [Gammaproteobacteria bacterium]|nr:thioredoxin fold domain-containing protein [Gammaproteobacteria bacterium]